MQFKDRLKYLRETFNLNKKELSEIVKFAPSTISMYESGERNPSIENLEILADFFNVDIDYLLGKTDYTTKIVPSLPIKNLISIPKSNKKIPLIGTIAAGTPILAEENIETHIELDRVIKADFCLRVKGDSMINANIQDKDIVFIKQQPDVNDGEIAAVLIEDEATLKRVYKMLGQVVLRSENPKYPPIILNGDKEVRILGKAIYKLSKIY